jgi:lipopolysaccharide export system permease protein
LTPLKTLHTYLIRQVLASLLMTVVVFTFVLLLGNVLKEVLTLLINRQASLGLVSQAIGLLIPFVWVFALPMGMLTATLLIFGRFSADQELTAVRASGVSLPALISPIILLSLALCAASACINLEVAPRCRVAYKNLMFKLKAELATAQIPEGRFIKEFPGYIFFVGKNRDNLLEDIMVYKLQGDSNVTLTVRAPRGKVDVDLTNQSLTLSLFDARSVSLAQGWTGAGDIIIPLSLADKSKPKRSARLDEMTFSELQAELGDMERLVSTPAIPKGTPEETRARLKEAQRQKKDLTTPIRVQMHRQVSFSFACFGFTLIGIPLGIQVHRRETNIGIAIALLLAGVYYSFVLLGLSLDTKPEYAPHLIIWLPNFLFQAVGGVLLWRAGRVV